MKTLQNKRENYKPVSLMKGPPGGASGKEAACQCRRRRINSWVGTILLRRKWQPTPVILPGKSHGQRSLMGYSPRSSSVAQSCPTLCDPMDCSMPGFPVCHQLLELAQTLVYRIIDAFQPSHHPLSSPSPAFSLSQRHLQY